LDILVFLVYSLIDIVYLTSNFLLLAFYFYTLKRSYIWGCTGFDRRIP